MSGFKSFINHVQVSFVLLAFLESFIFIGAAFLGLAIPADTTIANSSAVSTSLYNPLPSALMFAVINMLGMLALGLYRVDLFPGHNGFTQTLARILVSMLLASIALVVLCNLFPNIRMGRTAVMIAVVSSLLAIATVRRFAFTYFRQDRFISRVIVFGVGNNAARLINANNEKQLNASYKIVGFVSSPGQARVVPQNLIIEASHSLTEQVRILDASEIVIALDDRSENFPMQQILDCKLSGIKITDPHSFLEREYGRVDLSLLNPAWMVFSAGYKGSILRSVSTRMFDVVTSVSILVITAPILLVVTFWIAFEGNFKETTLYRQKRVGKNGEYFDLLKFRSMRLDRKSTATQWGEQDDFPVTWFSRSIRTLRIDELPQLINILRGEMSLVGPSPERPESVDKLSRNIDFYRQRHSIKPGLAGWAQLKYPYGTTEQDAFQKLQYDLYYIKNANVVMDFFILLQTLQILLFRKVAR